MTDGSDSDEHRFGMLVRETRTRLGWTQADLAHEAFGNSERKGYISGIERGMLTKIQTSSAQNICRALNIDPLLIPARYRWPEALEKIVNDFSDASWASDLTAHYASGDLRSMLKRAKRFDLVAADDGLLLYQGQPTELGHTVPIRKAAEQVPHELVDPSAQELKAFPLKTFHPEISEFLTAEAELEERGRYQTKLGLSKILPPVHRIGQPLSLDTNPVSYWTLQSFNRMLGDGPKSVDLTDMKRRCIERLLERGDTLSMDFPSALYVEAAVTTSDDKLIIVEKNPILSAFARSGRRWTATIEEGLSWHYFAEIEEVDLHKAIGRGLNTELGVLPAQILQVEFNAIGLEVPTLNTAILGEVTLSLASKEILRNIRESEDYTSKYHLVDWKDVPEKIFRQPMLPSSEWHPLARLRCFLGLTKRLGQLGAEEVLFSNTK